MMGRAFTLPGFQRLRVKLTVLYASLFCVALVLIGATASAVIARNAQQLAQQQLSGAADAFDRVWTLRLDRYRDNARQLAQAPPFLDAVAARDENGVRAGLNMVRARSGADVAFFVTREGWIIGERGAPGVTVPPGLQQVLESTAEPAGAMRAGGVTYDTATARAAGDFGWVVVGARVASDDRVAFGALARTPMQPAILSRDGAAWVREGSAPGAPYDDAANAVRRDDVQSVLRTDQGEEIVLARPLASIDGSRNVLLVRYPLSNTLSPYRTLFGTLLLIGLVGLILLILSTWFLARGIVQPISSLEDAAKNLREGTYDSVVVRGRDELARLAENFNSMAEAIRERERRITQLAFHDTETGLANRAALERRLMAAQQPQRIFLAAIGVERFAHVRGAIGYTLAGALMRTLGARLVRLVPNAPVARLASDVLGVALLADNELDAKRRAAALVPNLEQSLSLDGQVVDVHVRIGIAQPRGKTETASSMIERASVALDQARQAHCKVGLFDENAYGDPGRNLSLMGDMRRGLENGEIYVVHQPKYHYRTGRISSAETLVRWRHPSRGAIAPDLFVPMAEETGHIRVLTEWVLRAAIADQRRFAEAACPLTLSINISGRLLGDDDFARFAIDHVNKTGAKLCFEITETAVIDNPKAALENIRRFSAEGIRISIDDYGSGLSSLAYLKQLRGHELKIDKLFLQNLTNNQRDALLLRSTIDLAHGLGMEVTAEGVETPAAFSLLASMNCDYAQGFVICRPSSVEDVVSLLSDEKRLRFYQQAASAGAGAEPPSLVPKSA